MPGTWDWETSSVYNPPALHEDRRFCWYKRASGSLRADFCCVRSLEGTDGVRFRHLSDRAVLASVMMGSAYGGVQDLRIVRIDDAYWMAFAYRRFAFGMSPTGLGALDAALQNRFPGFDPTRDTNLTRSGIAVSHDRVHWGFLGWPTRPTLMTAMSCSSPQGRSPTSLRSCDGPSVG